SGDDHTHRIGRTGRAGQEGKAVTLIDSNEWNQMSSIERYLKIRFEHRTLAGLKANYSGPKNIKKSGKAAGPKKKKTAVNKAKTTAVKRPKKIRKKAKAQSDTNDGFEVLKKR
ncbi:MAG: ATP-dependent helicase, partial [Porticoccus sp.]|nr:ATP-dependent helicase [Porticoccus sp.]